MSAERHGGIEWRSVVLNSPDPQALARFYAALLGWELSTDEPDWATIVGPLGERHYLGFQRETLYVRPVWPAQAGEPQMMMHLDIHVDDLEAACAWAQACGATLAGFQPQDDVRVHLDPDGHPFCLWTG